MKWFLFLLGIVSSCLASGQGLVKLQGKVEYGMADSIEVSYNDNNLAYYPHKYSSKLDKTGRFSLSFPVPASYTIVQIQYGNSLADILVKPGDSMVMVANARRFDSSVHYVGRGADVQNFIAAHTVSKGRMNQYPGRIKMLIQKDEKEFLAGMDAEYKAEEAALKKWKPALPALFVQYWLAYHRYYNYFFIEQYPQTKEMLKLRRFTDTVSPEFYKIVDKLPLAFNDSFVHIPPYILYLTGILETKVRANGFTWHVGDTLQKRLFEDSMIRLAYARMPDKSLENYLAQNIYGKAKGQDLARTEAQLSNFRGRWPSSALLPLLDKQVGIARRLAPGQPAPDFEFTDADGNKKHLSDLKGKVVYIGFWAGWCRQCVGEMLKEQMVKDLIRKKPLEFVYVSLGTDTATERAIVDRYRISGNFTNLVNGWNAKEVQEYGVQSLPAYYLVDEDGKFAAQNPPTPLQTTELVMAIEKLFK